VLCVANHFPVSYEVIEKLAVPLNLFISWDLPHIYPKYSMSSYGMLWLTLVNQ